MASKQVNEKLTLRLTELCEQLVQALVKKPEEVSVSYDRRRESLQILVADSDRGLVIGRGGQNLLAIEHSLLVGVQYLIKNDQTLNGSPLHLGLSSTYGLPSFEVRVNKED